MEIHHYTSLIYADYCCFFSIGNIELFRAYQNLSCWENLHVHSLPPPPGPWDSGFGILGLGTLGPRNWDFATWDFWPLDPGTRNLTLRTLELEHWDPETSNLTPPQIVLNLSVKQILIIKSYGMYVKNIKLRIQKIKVRYFETFLCQSLKKVVRASPFKKKNLLFTQLKALKKWWKMLFISS